MMTVNAIHCKKTEQDEMLDVNEWAVPPCIRKMMVNVKKGRTSMPIWTSDDNYVLTCFLRSIGVDRAKILKMFRTLKNFDEKQARFQIDHIADALASGAYKQNKCVDLLGRRITTLCPCAPLIGMIERGGFSSPCPADHYYKWIRLAENVKYHSPEMKLLNNAVERGLALPEED
jgi:DNA primase large subunit